MPPPLLFDPPTVDPDHTVFGRDEIYRRLPQRHEFELLDGVSFLDRDKLQLIAFANIEESAWWAKGHIPGRPLLPGVLMLEMAAHAASILAIEVTGYKAFLAFGGVDKCKFREAVPPPARLDILCLSGELRSRRFVSETQGLVDGKLVFSARVTGLTTG